MLSQNLVMTVNMEWMCEEKRKGRQKEGRFFCCSSKFGKVQNDKKNKSKNVNCAIQNKIWTKFRTKLLSIHVHVVAFCRLFFFFFYFRYRSWSPWTLPNAGHIPVVTVSGIHLAITTSFGRVQDVRDAHHSQVRFVFGRRPGIQINNY